MHSFVCVQVRSRLSTGSNSSIGQSSGNVSSGQQSATSSASGVYNLQTSFAQPPPTHLPGTIDEQEEISRLSSLMQRDNLIRKLGIVDLIRVIVSSASRQPNPNHHHQHHNRNSLQPTSQQLPQQNPHDKSHSAATLAAIQHRLQVKYYFHFLLTISNTRHLNVYKAGYFELCCLH